MLSDKQPLTKRQIRDRERYRKNKEQRLAKQHQYWIERGRQLYEQRQITERQKLFGDYDRQQAI